MCLLQAEDPRGAAEAAEKAAKAYLLGKAKDGDRAVRRATRVALQQLQLSQHSASRARTREAPPRAAAACMADAAFGCISMRYE